jgi:hypothetical protein
VRTGTFLNTLSFFLLGVIEVNDESLAEYITAQLRQGYSEEQIRQTLLQNGYPRSMIDAAFTVLRPGRTTTSHPPATIAAANPLASYIKTYVAQGYRVEQLRPFLLQQGYPASQVDAAIAAATGQLTVRHEVHLPAATMMKVAALLIIVAGIIFGITLLRGAGPTAQPPVTASHLLDTKLSLTESNVQPGAKITATADLTNMGSGSKYDVTLSYQLLNADGTAIWSGGQKTKAISTSLSDTEQITIPPGTSDGTYTVKVTAEYGASSPAVATAPLTVQAEQGGTTAQPTINPPAPIGHLPPVVVVTSGEQDTALADATTAAKRGDSAGAEALCKAITNQARHDTCLATIVLSDHQASHCDAITSQDARETCYMPFIMEGRYELCANLQTQERKDLCENLKHLSSLNTTAAQQPGIGQFATPT